MAKRWALLIGIDFYFRGSERPVFFNHLKGCVRDVRRIEEYLLACGVHGIEKLTASWDGSSDKPMEAEQETWPTHDNIKKKLDSIHSRAKEGDLIYIHYSGHGILRNRLSDLEDDMGDMITGTALAPTDVMAGGPYLTGYQLGVWIRELVERDKIRVCLVLDSCYSGRGFRGSEIVPRTAVNDIPDESILESDEAADKAAADKDAVMCIDDTATGHKSSSNHRNAAVRRSWLSNPTGCTVLSACELDQTAGEYAFESPKGWGGILTHWMLDILSRQLDTQAPTYARVAQYVKSMIKTAMMWKTDQTPVLHGDSFFEFFGTHQFIQRPANLVYVSEQPGSSRKLLSVEVGSAQGVAPGSIYSVYPSHWRFERDRPSRSNTIPGLEPETAIIAPKIRIEKCLPFRSEATLIDESQKPENMVIVTGSLAVLESPAFPSPFGINVVSPKNMGSNENPNVETLIHQLSESIERNHGIFAPFSSNDDTSTNYRFEVAINVESKMFEIRDYRSIRLPRVPTISIGDERGIAKVIHILRRIARYTALECLEYSPKLGTLSPDNFRFEAVDKDGQYLPQVKGLYEANDRQEIELRFFNLKAAENTHVAIFSFNATWGVEKMYPEDGQPTAHVPPVAEAAVSVVITMEIPKGSPADPLDITDLFRAYVYTGDHPPSWDEIVLPNLPTDASVVPVDLPVEPILEEDVGDGLSRNGTKPRSRRTNRKRDAPDKNWTVLDLRVHTSPN
ncbi:caspase domain-containing protein [Aspergillus foveolatus]|uniref:caspase domain-containing protein n=1 Tax=Aspergillus foveolatus TaxID=210207 RepID=UPI003CCD3F8B